MKRYELNTDEFVIGDGKTLFKFNFKGIEFIFNIIPVNGACSINNGLEFFDLDKFKKIKILINGLFFNLIGGILGSVSYLILPKNFIKIFVIWNVVFIIISIITGDRNSDLKRAIGLYKNIPLFIEADLEKLIDSLDCQIDEVVKSNDIELEDKIYNINLLIKFMNKEYGFPDNIYQDKYENVNDKMNKFYNKLLNYKQKWV